MILGVARLQGPFEVPVWNVNYVSEATRSMLLGTCLPYWYSDLLTFWGFYGLCIRQSGPFAARLVADPLGLEALGCAAGYRNLELVKTRELASPAAAGWANYSGLKRGHPQFSLSLHGNIPKLAFFRDGELDKNAMHLAKAARVE